MSVVLVEFMLQNGGTVSINPAQIAVIGSGPGHAGTAISMANGATHYVNEDYATVTGSLSAAP